MIKEYKEIKIFVDRLASCHHLNAAVVVDEIYTDEYNALDVRIMCSKPGFKVTTKFYLMLKQETNFEFGNVVKSYEMVTSGHETSIILYLQDIEEIRSQKIHKIRNNLVKVA